MRRLSFTLLLCACTHQAPASSTAPSATTRPPQAFTSSLTPLETAIRERLARETGDYGIAVIDIETGRSLGVNDRMVFHAASTMKVPVLLELYRRASEGTIALDGRIPVRSTFRSIADTSHYTLSASDDSESALYDMVGQQATLRDLARRMTVRSSNLATNILIEHLGAPTIQTTTERVGGFGMRVLRGVEDTPAFRAGLNNVTTARGLANVLASIARCDVLARAQCDEVVNVLAAQEFNEMIPSGLPAGTRVAHKTGTITGIQHDAAIVLPAGAPPFVVVVLTRNPADSLAPERVAGDVARLAWQALGPDGTLRPHWNARTTELLALHNRVRNSAFPAPTLPYDEYWATLTPILQRSASVQREEIGKSSSGKPLYLLRWGSGPTKVLLWSQMHGDETTASRALTDLFNYIIANPTDPRVQRWSQQVSLLVVPMLNPDGADGHRRRSTFGIDINRDARNLATPEGRALKAVQEKYQPQFGFNLHDQNPRSRAGTSDGTAAISLLAPPPDAKSTETPSFTRAKQLAAFLAVQLAPLVGNHLTQYDGTYNARAFGDGMSAWGVSAVLIETGSWDKDESKHYLRATNFVALVTALDAIGDGSYAGSNVAAYTSLPENGRSYNDLWIRGASIVLSGMQPVRADITIDAQAVGGPTATQIVDIGDLTGTVSRDTIDATGLFLHASGREILPGQFPEFNVRRTADPVSELVWEIRGARALRYK